MLNENNTLDVFVRLHKTVEIMGMSGYDPRLLWYLPAAVRYYKNKSKFNNFIRRIEVAVCRYIPLVVPIYLKLCKIPLVENPYGLGLLVQSYVNIYKKTKDIYWLDQAKKREKKLRDYLVATSSGLGVSVPLEDPTVTNIPAGAEVAIAYLSLYEICVDDYYIHTAEKIAYSFLNDHNLKKNNKGICIDYYSNDDGMHVLNANALAMEVIYRVNKLRDNNKTISSIVEEMFKYNLFYIKNYRELPYAGEEDRASNGWCIYDVYHTGFTLRSMKYFCDHEANYSEFLRDLEKVYEKMKVDFINANGKITVLKGSKVIDIHGVAEFLRCNIAFEKNNKIFFENFNYMKKNDSFYYQRGIVDADFYMPRWGHAPMMLALSELI